MLDLDSMARARALALNEEEGRWKNAVWSAGFQNLSREMSDGEVETMISACPSVGHFERLVGFLTDQSSTQNLSPYQVLVATAQDAGLSLHEWVAQRLR